MDQVEFNKLHESCVEAFRSYAVEADKTSAMLADCTPGPMPFPRRLGVMLQEVAENSSHSFYLATKRLLHNAARLGYAFSDGKEPPEDLSPT
jgi:hypothetical protein